MYNFKYFFMQTYIIKYFSIYYFNKKNNESIGINIIQKVNTLFKIFYLGPRSLFKTYMLAHQDITCINLSNLLKENNSGDWRDSLTVYAHVVLSEGSGQPLALF